MQAPSIPSACVFRPVTSGMSSIPSHPDATCIPSHRGVPPHRDVFHHQNSSGCVLHHQIGMCHPNTWLEVSTHASSNPYKFSVMQVSIPKGCGSERLGGCGVGCGRHIPLCLDRSSPRRAFPLSRCPCRLRVPLYNHRTGELS